MALFHEKAPRGVFFVLEGGSKYQLPAYCTCKLQVEWRLEGITCK